MIIDAGTDFAHSGGQLNHTIAGWDMEFFKPENGFEVKMTKVDDGYEPEDEAGKFIWADCVIYHFPVWWMYVPFTLKEYLDRVLTSGHRAGMYYSDGRKAENPERNYGKGGLMQGRKYMVTTTWNAPETAFTIPEEFFQGRSVDDGVLFPFHCMNAFVGLEPLQSFHFHDIEKNNSHERIENYHQAYLKHLAETFQLTTK